MTLKEQRRRDGQCVECGEPVEKPGSAKCNYHKAKDAEYREMITKARKAAGVCIKHPDRPVKPGTTMCQECITKSTAGKQAHNAKKKAELGAVFFWYAFDAGGKSGKVKAKTIAGALETAIRKLKKMKWDRDAEIDVTVSGETGTLSKTIEVES